MSLLEIFLKCRPMTDISQIKRTKELNEYELLIEQVDGQKYIYDTMKLYSNFIKRGENENAEYYFSH